MILVLYFHKEVNIGLFIFMMQIIHGLENNLSEIDAYKIECYMYTMCVQLSQDILGHLIMLLFVILKCINL